MDDLTEEYPEIFLNIEMNVIKHCERHSDFVDYHIDKVYEGVQRTLEKELAGKNPPRLRWNDSQEDLFALMMLIVAGSTGETIETTEGEPIELVEKPVSKEVMVSIFKRLRASVSLWTGQNAFGRRGYIDYIRRALPLE